MIRKGDLVRHISGEGDTYVVSEYTPTNYMMWLKGAFGFYSVPAKEWVLASTFQINLDAEYNDIIAMQDAMERL